MEYKIYSRKLVSGKDFSITQVCNAFDDIQDPRFHMRRRTFF